MYILNGNKKDETAKSKILKLEFIVVVAVKLKVIL